MKNQRLKSDSQISTVNPLDLLIPTPVAQPAPLTTTTQLTPNLNPVLPSSFSVKGKVGGKPTVKIEFTNELAGKSRGVPPSPPLIYVSDQLQPAVGVYLYVGSTGSGKTVSACALAAWCNSAGTPASYISCFEPRSNIGVAKAKVFINPLSFILNARSVITPLQTGSNGEPQGKLIIFDSVNLPMKAYAANFPNQPTFSGGLQPSDRGFLDQLAIIASEKAACLMVTINPTQIPYAAELEGAVEGIITVIDASNFTITDRTSYSARRAQAIRIPDVFVQASLTENNLGTLRATATANPMSGLLTQRSGMYKRQRPEDYTTPGV